MAGILIVLAVVGVVGLAILAGCVLVAGLIARALFSALVRGTAAATRAALR